MKTWVEVGGLSNHLPILLWIQGHGHKPAAPFKFNPSWLQEEDYCKILIDSRIPLEDIPNVTFMKQFSENIQRTKNETKKWAKIYMANQ